MKGISGKAPQLNRTQSFKIHDDTTTHDDKQRFRCLKVVIKLQKFWHLVKRNKQPTINSTYWQASFFFVFFYARAFWFNHFMVSSGYRKCSFSLGPSPWTKGERMGWSLRIHMGRTTSHIPSSNKISLEPLEIMIVMNLPWNKTKARSQLNKFYLSWNFSLRRRGPNYLRNNTIQIVASYIHHLTV